ncbi:MAG: hypothetical protein K2Q26_13905 [Bdellovibrionales bacterium]|nr:hypothetical protein [Bdellovibrionales bacterium]
MVKALHSILLIAALLLVTSACSKEMKIISDRFSSKNMKVEGFKKPQEEDYFSVNNYMFEWQPFERTGVQAQLPFPENLYHVTVYESDDCSGPAFFRADTAQPQFDMTGLSTVGIPMTMGVQIRFPDLSLGPLQCSKTVERDTVPPTLTLVSSSASPSRDASVTLSGVCTDNRKIKEESTIRICIKQNAVCTPADYSVTVDCMSGNYSYTFAPAEGLFNVSAYAVDHAQNASTSETLGLVIYDRSPPMALNFISPASAIVVGASQFEFTWLTSDAGLAGLSLTQPFELRLYNSNNCSGGIVSTSNPMTASQTVTGLADGQTYSASVTVRDEAGNISNAFCSPAITVAASAPVLALSDSTNTIVPNQSSFAKTLSISASISNDAAADEWCLSETQSSAPTAMSCSGTGWLGARPTSFVLSGGDGNKTVYLWIKDVVNNVVSLHGTDTLVLDTDAPDVDFSSSPLANTEHDSSVVISGACETGLAVNVAGAGVANPGSATCGSGTYSFIANFTAGDGSKVVQISQLDNASNVTQISRTFINDTTAPVIAITAPAALANVSGSLMVSGTCEDGYLVNFTGDINPVAGVMCSGGVFSRSVVLNGVDGAKTVNISQTDAAGNTGIDSRNFILDTTLPVITQTTLTTPYYSNTNTVTFGGTCETGLAITARRSGVLENTTTCAAGTWSYSVAAQTTDGTYNYTFEQTDAANNLGVVAGQWIRDTVNPVLTFTSASSWTTFGNSVTFTGTCESGLGNIVVSGIDSATTACSSGSWSYTVATQTTNANRSYTFTLTDAAGNATAIAGSWVRTIVAPVFTLTDTTNTIFINQSNYAKTTTVTASITNDNGATAWCLSETQSTAPTSVSCSGTGWLATRPTSFVLSTPDATKTVYVWLKDNLDNVLSLSDTHSIVLDRVAPSVAISTPVANSVHAGSATLTGTCESGITVVFSGDITGSPTASCVGGTFSQTVSFSAAQGAKSVQIEQQDAASNTATASRSFINDTLAPNLTIDAPIANTSAQSGVTLTGSCETGLNIQFTGDLLSNLTVMCSGGAYSQSVFFSAGNGTKSISVSQTDGVGNVALISRNFIRDTVAPAITQTTLAYPHYSNTNTVTFGGACETGLTVTIRRGGVGDGTAPCTAGTWSYSVATQATDATYDYTFEQTDAALNVGSTAGRWVRDTNPPTLTFTSSSSFVTPTNTVTFAGNCESGLPNPIAVSGTDSNTTPCSSGNWSYTVATQVTDGTRGYNFTLFDRAGNSTVIVGSWERNTQYPALTVTSATTVINTGITASFSGNCEAGIDVEVRLGGSLIHTMNCPGGTFIYSPNEVTDGNRVYELRQTNALPLSTNVNVTWIRDTAGPVFTAGLMDINENAVESNLARVFVDAQAIDALTKVTHFCFKLNNTAPLPADSCFVAVDDPAVGLTPSGTLNLVNYPFNLPIVPDNYVIYAWAKDEANNVSVMTASGAGTTQRDKDDIFFVVYNPPEVKKLIIGSNDFPADPPSNSDLTVGAGQPLYIKWEIADDKPFPGTPVDLYFTTDDIAYTLIVAGLNNGQNGTCTINHGSTSADDTATGCYYWASAPVGGYMRIRAVVRDSDGLSAGFTSVGMNVATSMRFIAGNTDLGTNLSAQAAMFTYRSDSYLYATDSHSVVVARDGTVYFKDAHRGILKVDAADGVQRLFIPKTGNSTGDNGPVANATVRYVTKIALDHNLPTQRLLLFDYDRIRRVDLATGIITTVVGGSGSDDSDNVANPLQARVDPLTEDMYWMRMLVFMALPNGDFHFQASNDRAYGHRLIDQPRIRILKANNTIESFKVNTVTSTTDLPAYGDIQRCRNRGIGIRYDKATSTIMDRILSIRIHPYWNPADGCTTGGDLSTYSALDNNGNSLSVHPPRVAYWTEHGGFHTGLDGNLYLFYKPPPSGIWKYQPGAPGSWTQIVGHPDGANGDCADGTPALSCRGTISDMFVQEDGTLYYLDSGRIRTLTPNGNIVTLMGQGLISGEGGPALSARLGTGLHEFRPRNNSAIVFSSRANNKLYEFDPEGTLYHLAGNGRFDAAATGVDARMTATNFEWPHNTGDDFGLDPVTGDVYHHAGTWDIMKLTRDTAAVGSPGQWSLFQGQGTYHWSNPAADGQSSIHFTSECGSYGFDAGTRRDPHCWYSPQVAGFGNNKLFMHKDEHSFFISTGGWSTRNRMVKLYDVTTKIQTPLVGVVGYGSGNDNTTCPDGVSLAACEFFTSHSVYITTPIYDSVDNKWMTVRTHWSTIYRMVPGGVMQASWTVSEPVIAFAHRRYAGDEYIYYCSNSSRQIRRKNMNSGVEVALPWPIAAVKCVEGSMHWDNNRGSLVFLYEQNGLHGFAEYLDPAP